LEVESAKDKLIDQNSCMMRNTKSQISQNFLNIDTQRVMCELKAVFSHTTSQMAGSINKPCLESW
jgi:hypothetical protein